MIAPGQIISIARELVAQGPSKQRVQALWAVAKYSARSAAAETFLQLAVDTNLIDGDGYWTILLQKSLAILVNDDSVALTRFAVEAIDDGAAQSRPG